MKHLVRLATVACAWLALGATPALAQQATGDGSCGTGCPPGTTCMAGACFPDAEPVGQPDACAGVTCAAGHACYLGSCFDVALSAPELIQVPSRNRAPPAVILRVPVRISEFPGAPDGEVDDPAAEIQCYLLDAQGNLLGSTPEFLVPPLPGGGSYDARLSFEADLYRADESRPITGYRCTMKRVVGSGTLCDGPSAGEGSVCEVTGALVLP